MLHQMDKISKARYLRAIYYASPYEFIDLIIIVERAYGMNSKERGQFERICRRQRDA